MGSLQIEVATVLGGKGAVEAAKAKATLSATLPSASSTRSARQRSTLVEPSISCPTVVAVEFSHIKYNAIIISSSIMGTIFVISLIFASCLVFHGISDYIFHMLVRSDVSGVLATPKHIMPSSKNI